MTEDQSLLHQYAQEGWRQALDQIVRRHIALVYSSALRQVRDPDLSQDITQAVFLVLAQKARSIRNGEALSGWLLAVTRRACVDAMRKRATQRRHEQAAARNESTVAEADRWTEIEPLLDAAMDQLPSVDRDAIVLRYFRDRSFVDVGVELGITEQSARRRVSRAVEKLRGIFAKDRVALPAAALVGAIAAHSTAAAVPPALVTTIVSGTAVTTLGASIAKGAITMMVWTKAKVAALLIAGTIIITGGAAIVTIATAQPAQNNPTSSPSTRAAAPTSRAAAQDPRQLNARIQAAKMDLLALETALDAFEIDNGRYPTAAEGLGALIQRPATAAGWHGPYIRMLPADPWGQPYHYVYPGIHLRNGFDLWSTGPDQTDGTTDDIKNWP